MQREESMQVHLQKPPTCIQYSLVPRPSLFEENDLTWPFTPMQSLQKEGGSGNKGCYLGHKCKCYCVYEEAFSTLYTSMYTLSPTCVCMSTYSFMHHCVFIHTPINVYKKCTRTGNLLWKPETLKHSLIMFKKCPVYLTPKK